MFTVNFPVTGFPKVYLRDCREGNRAKLKFLAVFSNSLNGPVLNDSPGPDGGLFAGVQVTDVGRRIDDQLKLGHYCNACII